MKILGSRRSAVARRAAAGLAALVLLPLGAISASPAHAATGDVGFQGPSYAGAERAASGDKPQSKLWYGHSNWWAVMWDTKSADWHIFRLKRSTHTWVDTGVLVDKRASTLSDVKYDASGKLYIASHVVTFGIAMPGNAARLMRYSYVDGAWKADSGFPTQVMDYSTESMTIDEDSLGEIWATWTQVAPGRTNGAVYAARSAKGGTSWGKPFLVPAADAGGNLPRPDDISTVVAFGKNKIGVLWGNQTTSAFYWSVHTDGASTSTWAKTTAFQKKAIADDHLNIKSLQSDAAGRVYAVMKTDFNDITTDKTQPQVILAMYSPSAGWSRRTVWTIGDCVTRPLVMLNKSTQQLSVMATAPESGCRYSGQRGVIWQKTVSLANPTFAKGRGKIIMKDADSADLSNVTGTKQSVNSTSGLVLLATNPTTKRYWFSDSKAG